MRLDVVVLSKPLIDDGLGLLVVVNNSAFNTSLHGVPLKRSFYPLSRCDLLSGVRNGQRSGTQ